MSARLYRCPGPALAVAEDDVEQDLEVADEEEREEREEEPVHMPDPIEKEDVVSYLRAWCALNRNIASPAKPGNRRGRGGRGRNSATAGSTECYNYSGIHQQAQHWYAFLLLLYSYHPLLLE